MILLLLESPDIGLPNHNNLFSAYRQTCKLPVWIHGTNLPVSRVSSLHVAYMAAIFAVPKIIPPPRISKWLVVGDIKKIIQMLLGLWT